MHQANEAKWHYRVMWICAYTCHPVLIWEGEFMKYSRGTRQWIYDFGNGHGASVVQWPADLDIIHIILTGNKDGNGYPEYEDPMTLSVHVDTIDDVMDVVRDMIGGPNVDTD